MLKVYFLTLVVLLFAHCGGDESVVPPSQKPVDKDVAVVENITENLIYSGMENLVLTTEGLSIGAAKACSGEGLETKTLQEDWKKSMQVFHYLEAAPYGVFIENKIKGCKDGELACRIYSFPSSNEDAVSIQMKKAKDQGENYEFLTGSQTAIGLDAIEYLLFETLKTEKKVTGASEACPYLQLLAEDTAVTSAELFKRFVAAQEANALLETTEDTIKEELQEIAKSFSFFKQTFLYIKVNRLLNLPGSSLDDFPHSCTTECFEYMEHRWAKMAKEALQWNLESFQQIYSGDVAGEANLIEGFGIQDYLKELGKEKESLSPLVTSQKILDIVGGFESGLAFQEAVEDFSGRECKDGEGSLCELQVQAKALASWLGTDLFNLLSIEATNGGVGGDAD